MTESIIVYRNPAEAAFWESGMAFPLMVAMVNAVIAAVFVDWLLRHIPSQRVWSFRRKYGGALAGWSAILAAVATMWTMMTV